MQSRRIRCDLPLLTISAIFAFSLALYPRCEAQDEAGSQQNRQQAADAQSARPFEGKIARPENNPNGRLVLQELSTGQSYALDHQEIVKRYAGKNVKIIATIDPKTNTLHIVDITPIGVGK